MNNLESNEQYNSNPNNQLPPKNSRAIIWLPLVIAFSIAIGVFLGNAFTRYNAGGSLKPLFQRNGTKMDALLDYMNKAYVDTVNISDVIENAIPQIIATLDPHSAYIPAEDMKTVGTELDGHFGGIGVEFMLLNDTINIVNVTLGGPSEAMGIMAGDKIITVNDSVFAGNSLNNAKVMNTLRGAIGSKVKIGIKRLNSAEAIAFDLTRAEIPVESVDVSYMIGNDIGYVKISRFAGTTYDEFITAVAKLKAQGAKSFILDLRGNIGGYLGAANLLTNEFLQGGDLIVYTEGRAYPRESFRADGSGICKDNEIVVLIDEHSASASEILAGAIQDNDRGLIVGRRSFGKGLVQSQYQFPDESAVRLTIARYHTPSGRCVQKPYERGNRMEYDLDLLRRFERGEFDSKDSIKMENLPVFYTKAGRPVYGDDGIMSDVFVPRDTTGVNSYYIKVSNSGILREYAFKYTEENRTKLKAMKNWEEAYNFLTNTPLVDNLVTYAETKNVRKRPVLIAEAYASMKKDLEALILRNIFSDKEAFFKVYQRDNKIINEAVSLIKQGKAKPEAVAEELYILK